MEESSTDDRAEGEAKPPTKEDHDHILILEGDEAIIEAADKREESRLDIEEEKYYWFLVLG